MKTAIDNYSNEQEDKRLTYDETKSETGLCCSNTNQTQQMRLKQMIKAELKHI